MARLEGIPARTRPRQAQPNTDYAVYPWEVTVPEAVAGRRGAYPAGTLSWDTEATSGGGREERSTGHWRVRNRRAAAVPAHRLGGQKLKDFVDRKLPRQRRDTVPLVVDERDRIVWVAGFGIDEAFRVTDPTQAVIMLELKLLGGSA
jgi:hypothetical protein